MSRFNFSFLLAILAVLSIPSTASAQAVQEYEYQSDRIYPVRAGLGLTTQIELSPNEKVLDYSTGFSNGWELTRRDNVFYLKPKNVDVDTNMVIRTATNSYIFELKVVSTDWETLEQAKREGVQYKIVFRYPNDTSFTEGAEVEKKVDDVQLNTTLEKTRVYNYNYDYATRNRKAAWLVPVNVYDDGRFTYIRMGDMKNIPTGNFPSVYARDKARGEDFVINSTVENNMIIVHGTYPFLTVRHGKNVVGLRRNTNK